MNPIRNYVTLIGNIGSQTEITEFDNGQRVARFQLATPKSLRKNNGRYTATVEWHRLFAWGNMAQFIEKYGEKGKKSPSMVAWYNAPTSPTTANSAV